MNDAAQPRDDLEDLLPGLLAEAAADPPGSPDRLDHVHRRAARRRRARAAAAAGSLAVVVLGAALTPVLLGQDRHRSALPALSDPTSGPATAGAGDATRAATPSAGSRPATLFSEPDTVLSSSLAVAYGTGPGTRRVTIPDGSRIGVVELACEGEGAIGVDDRGALGPAALPVPARPAAGNCGPDTHAEGDLVAENVRSGPNGVVAPHTPVTLTIRTTGDVRWWLVVGRVGGQSRSGLPNPDLINLGPAPAVEDLAGRDSAVGLLYQCGDRKELDDVTFTLSGAPITAVVVCTVPRAIHILLFATPHHLTGPVGTAVVRRAGTGTTPTGYSADLLTPSGLAAWSRIPGVLHGNLTH
jgi:hypothetical protein